MSLQLFNTLSGRKEEFKPIHGKEVRMYTCGPTVYDYAHIGNFRTYVFQDHLKRYLTHQGYQVRHVMNITDVDDKTIAAANQKGVSLSEYTGVYTKAFFEDLKTLGIGEPDEVLFATKTVPQMIRLIEALVKKKHAYEKDGSVYFRVASFPNYGKLSKKNLEKNMIGARVDQDEYEKEEGADFALWKRAKEEDIAAGAAWDSPWGKGRPGWHTECSAMSLMAFNNETLDIHTGGEDLIFPHHENEIAQSESVTGKKFVNYWLHARHLLVDGKKMSKKEKNFYTLRDLLKKNLNPMAIRYLLLSAHYRNPLNFTLESLQASWESLRRVNNFWIDHFSGKQYVRLSSSGKGKVSSFLNGAKAAFINALDDDLNASQALAVIFELIRKVNAVPSEDANLVEFQEVEFFLNDINRIFGVFEFYEQELSIPVQDLSKAYLEAHRDKDYKKKNELREAARKLGYRFEDARDDIKVKKI